MGSTDFESQLRGMRLTTAEIMYHMPDFRDILQTYIWKNYVFAPRFPKLTKFLAFWSQTLDGPLDTIRVYQPWHVAPWELTYMVSEWRVLT